MQHLKLNLFSLKITGAAVKCLWQKVCGPCLFPVQSIRGNVSVLAGLDKVQARDLSDTLTVLSAAFPCPRRLFGSL